MTESYSIDLSLDLKAKGRENQHRGVLPISPEGLEKMFEVTAVLMQSLDVNDVCERIMDALFSYFKRIDGGVILTLDPNGDLREVVARSKDKTASSGIRYSRTILDGVVREEKAVVISNVLDVSEGAFSDSLTMNRVKSLMCVPMISMTGIQGVIYLHSIHEPQAFQKEDLFFVAALSTPVALAIENLLLYSRGRYAEEELRRAREDLEKQVRERAAELIKANRQLQELSFTDGLTSLYNHRYLIRTLESEYRRALRYRRDFALLMVDVDYFKQVNDTYGHPCGDKVLQSIARLFKGCVRITDIVARYGGDEIAIILLEMNKATAMKVSEKLRRAVEKYPFDWEGEPFHVTVSIGVASAREKGIEDWNALLNAADKALYQAKERNRNTVVAFASPEATAQMSLFGK
jgi:diguanylate cyclase (GGDEF)-like protein